MTCLLSVSQLSLWWHDQNKFDCSQMPPYKATNVTTLHTQGQLLPLHRAVFHLVLCTSNTFKLRFFVGSLHLFVITQHTVRELCGCGMLTQQHSDTVQQEFTEILFQWKTKQNLYALEMTTYFFTMVRNFFRWKG